MYSASKLAAGSSCWSAGRTLERLMAHFADLPERFPGVSLALLGLAADAADVAVEDVEVFKNTNIKKILFQGKGGRMTVLRKQGDTFSCNVLSVQELDATSHEPAGISQPNNPAIPSGPIDPSGIEARVELPFVLVRKGRTVPDLGELYEQPERWLEEQD